MAVRPCGDDWFCGSCEDCLTSPDPENNPRADARAEDERIRASYAETGHHPSCCGACDTCERVCSGYHGPERRSRERPRPAPYFVSVEEEIEMGEDV